MSNKYYSGPSRFAHRGLTQAAPENTLSAFQAVIDNGFEGIEIDIQMSKDKEIIVVHDQNLTRLTLGHPTGFCNRKIADMTWDELKQVELPFANHTLPRDLPHHSDIEAMAIMPERLLGQEKNSDYETALAKDGRMAHLMRFIDFDLWLTNQKSDVTVEVEVKSGGLIESFIKILDGSPNIERYILFSGVASYNAEIQTFCTSMGKPKGLRLGANIRYLTEAAMQQIKQMDLFEVGLNAWHFSNDDVCWLADRGIQVLSNLGDDPGWWDQLCKMDVLGFKTNYSDAFTAWWYNRKATEKCKF